MTVVEDSTLPGSGARARTVTGLLVAGVGLVCLIIMSIQPSLDPRVGVLNSVYSWYQWGLGLVVVAVGVGIAIGTQSVSVVSAAVGAVASAQLGAAGAVAFKHWYAFFGPRGDARHHEALETLALAMGLVCLVALAACLARLWIAESFSNAVSSAAVRSLTVCLGLALLVAVPVLLTIGDNGTQATTMLGLGLLYGAPWGVAVGVSAWLRQPAAAATCLVVFTSAVVAAVSHAVWPVDFEQFLSTGTQTVAFMVAAALAAAAASSRFAMTRS